MREEYVISSETECICTDRWEDVQHYQEEHKTLHYVGAQLDKTRNVVILKFVDTGMYDDET